MSKTNFKGTATVKTNGKSYNVKITGEVKVKDGRAGNKYEERKPYRMYPVKVYTGWGRPVVLDIPEKTYKKLHLDVLYLTLSE